MGRSVSHRPAPRFFKQSRKKNSPKFGTHLGMPKKMFSLSLKLVGMKAYQEGESTRGQERSTRHPERAKAVEPSGLRQLLRSRTRRPHLPDSARRRGRPGLPRARPVLQPAGRLRRAVRPEPGRDDAQRYSHHPHPAGQAGGPPDHAVLLDARTEPRAWRDALEGQLTRTIEKKANLF